MNYLDHTNKGSEMQPTLLVLAAGIGSRYGGLKQIVPVGPNGEIILDYSIHDAVQAGFGKVVFVIRNDIESEFRQSIGDRFSNMVPVEYVFQELEDLPCDYPVPEGRVKPWGTGHAILAARDVIDEPFAVINADDFYGKEGYRLLVEYLRIADDRDYPGYAMVGYALRNTLSDFGGVSRGICEYSREGFVTQVAEKHNITRDGSDARIPEFDGSKTMVSGDSLVSMNFWGFTPSVFNQLASAFREFMSEYGSELNSEFLIPTVVGSLLKKSKAKVTMLKNSDAWFGMTYREDNATVADSIRKLVELGHYPEKLFQ